MVGEYTSKTFEEYLRNNGIKHERTAPYTPQQNGIAERYNRTIVEMARTMIQHAHLPLRFWAEAVNTAVYIRNRCTTRALSEHTMPHELWTGSKPNVKHLKIFGCDAYALDNNYKCKFDQKASKCTFIGYAFNKTYRLWDNTNHKVITTRNVKFNEQSFHTKSDITEEDNNAYTSKFIEVPRVIQEQNNTEDRQNDESDDNNDNEEAESSTKNTRQHTSRELQSDLSPYWTSPARQRSDHLANNYAYAFYTASQIIEEPQTYKEAISSANSKEWIEAMQKEYDSLIENKTWNIVK